MNSSPEIPSYQGLMEHVSLVLAPSTKVLDRDTRGLAWWRNQRQATAWLAKMLVAGGFLAGSSAFAQYPPATQSYAPAYGAPSSPIYAQPLPEAANQSDEQLLTVGRLLEQQGRYAQAQRIYTELERRRFAGMQQRVDPQSNPNYPPQAMTTQQTMPAQQAYSPPNAWQAPQMQMATQAPMMQLTPQANVPVYDQRPQAIAPPAQASFIQPPPAPPSEAYVVDREITPAPKTSTPQPSEGWRSAFAPLPAALRSWSSDVPTPYQQQVRSSPASAGNAPSARVAAESNSLPDLPITPIASLGSIGERFPPKVPPAVPTAPPQFVPPAVASGDQRMLAFPDAVPRTPAMMQLRPMQEKRLESLEPERDAQELTNQTESIRIIPGQRSSLQLKPEANHTPIDLVDQPSTAPAAQKALPKWTPNPIATAPPVERQPSAAPERPPVQNPPAFSLAALLATPEFREIHTETVLQGLELLARPEAQHRVLGAIRVASAGAEGRTALPVLRKLLATEREKKVLLRLAETVLKMQPNDRTATACLSELLSDRNDWELRENVVAVLGNAAPGKNPVAVARLTDALDDSNSRVRAAAAESLALFGPAAVESASRLEGAAVTDIPSVQRAATLALAAIRGSETERPADRFSPTTRMPFDLNPLAPRPMSALPAGISMGRVKLSDQAAAAESVEPELPENKTAGAPPKLFPADRIAASHSMMASPEMADEAVPASATAAPQKKASAPALAPAPAPAPPSNPLPLELQPAPAPSPPANANVTPTATTTSTFFLQSETGESKAGAGP
jgi:HEAT repeat protein